MIVDPFEPNVVASLSVNIPYACGGRETVEDGQSVLNRNSQPFFLYLGCVCQLQIERGNIGGREKSW